MASDDRTTNPSRTIATLAGTTQRRPEVLTQACVVIIYGDELGRRIELDRSRVCFGRSSSSDVQIDQESISRNHCEITLRGNSYELRDLGSTNGTYVNDSPIETALLRDGDQIKVGRTIFKFILGSNVEGEYHELIYRLMTTDGLTQVSNKRFFDDTLEREVSRATRYKRPFSLILFDIDHFKQVNDTHGHLAGDAVLRQMGSLVRGRVRRDDIVARTGGEEFAIITPEIGLEGAVELAQKVNKLVASSTFEFDGVVIPITVSIGVAQWDASVYENPKDLVRAADAKLYEAKRGGRNRVES